MKKTLIALALAALPVAATADVTLYGQVKAGLEYTKAKGESDTITNANDWGTHVGFKGEEDLGNGLKTIWQLESTASIDSKARRSLRDSFIGLTGGFGTVRAGTLSDQFNSDMDTLDQWEGNGIRTLGATFGRTSARHTAVRYDSPNFGGFQFNVLYTPEDNSRYDQARANGLPSLGVTADDVYDLDNDFTAATGIIHADTWDRSVAVLGLNYENSGFYAKYGFKMEHSGANEGKSAQIHRLEGGYDANNLFVGLGFQYTKNYEFEDEKTKELALTAAYTMGNVTPRISYAHGFSDFKYDHVIGGVDYALSKRTTALLNVGWIRFEDKDDKAYSAGLGLRHVF